VMQGSTVSSRRLSNSPPQLVCIWFTANLLELTFAATRITVLNSTALTVFAVFISLACSVSPAALMTASYFA